MFSTIKGFFASFLLFLAIVPALAQEGGGSGGSGGSALEGWQLTYHYNGFTIRDYDPPTLFSGPQVPAQPAGVESAHMVCTTTVTVSWVGSGPAPQNHFLRIGAATFAWATSRDPQIYMQDSVESSQWTDSVQPIRHERLWGRSFLPLTDGLTLTLSAESHAQNSLSADPVEASAWAGFNFDIVDRAVRFNWIETFRRLPGGIAKRNDPHENAGKLRFDFGADFYYNSWHWELSLARRQNIGFFIEGNGWELPLNSLEIQTSRPRVTWLNENPFTGILEASIDAVLSNSEIPPWRINEGKAESIRDHMLGPTTWTFTGIARDNVGTEYANAKMHVHGPLEVTGENWASP
ncbi:hypothetical protein QPK87_37115 [Kamptonema cortianum]|nr:hypothetical protein [Geitlerinema splendidum]MDK3162129.1 hypothetical protein [Kamptonema cortianum]